MKLSQARNIIRSMIEFNLNLDENASSSSYLIPMLWSLPGEGKTTMVEDLVTEMGGTCQSVVAAQFDAGEMGGFPYLEKEQKRYYRARPFFLPTEEEAAQHKFIAIFGDELPQAPTANQNIWAQLTNERRIGEHKLPKNVIIVCAGNPLSAKAGTQAMPSHLKDRLTHLNIATDHEGFREYALTKGFSPVITSYIHERPEYLQKFDPKTDASPSPRSWERVNSILTLGLDQESEMYAIQGQIGEGAVADFVGYQRIWQSLPRTDDILKNPKGHKIPTDPAVMYALCSSLAHKATKANIKAIVEYADRFENKEFTAFLMKDAIQRNPEIKTEKVVSAWFFSTGKELML